MTVISQPSASAPGGEAGGPTVTPSPTRVAGSSLGRSRRRARSIGSRGSVRLRLTAIYGALFLACGAGLLLITYLLVAGSPFAPPPSYNPPAVSGNEPIGSAVERQTVLHTLLLRSGIALAIMALVSIWLGWIVAGRVLRPLRVITSRTRQISEENLYERLALIGPDDEITELSDTIDGLLSRLEGAFAAQRRFVADVSHELRTPLTMMRTSLDVASGKPQPMSPDAAVLSGKVREGLDQADRFVESFLMLARAEAQEIADLETVSLPDLVRNALEAQADAIDDLGLTVQQDLQDARATGSRTLLARLQANLIDNAVRHNRPAGFIGITTEVVGSTARLTVENSGRVISPDQAERLVERFRRLSPDRTGSETGVGLGLAIVAAIATAHDGAVRIQARSAGGLTVTVELPRARPETGATA
jgi:hypothetical protein